MCACLLFQIRKIAFLNDFVNFLEIQDRLLMLVYSVTQLSFAHVSYVILGGVILGSLQTMQGLLSKKNTVIMSFLKRENTTGIIISLKRIFGWDLLHLRYIISQSQCKENGRGFYPAIQYIFYVTILIYPAIAKCT